MPTRIFTILSYIALVIALTGCPGGGDSPPSTVPTAAVTGSVTFQWDASSDTDLAGYRVYRSMVSGAYGAPIATLSASATSYQATNLTKAATYFFVVSAYDVNGNESLFSNQVSRTVP